MHVLALVLALLAGSGAVLAQSTLSPGFRATGEGLADEVRAGREIWFNATANNDRFFTYTYPQRLGGAIDWWRILRADRKDDLFPVWGAIVDPDCCRPGDPSCCAPAAGRGPGWRW